jgi:DNA-binding response OmpR family regulator
MSSALHILHLEDDPRDTELMVATLRDNGIECEVVHGDSRDRSSLPTLLDERLT